MEAKLLDIEERLAKIEARMKTHWALQTKDDFAESYILRLRNELQASVFKIAIAAVVLLAGSGYVVIKYAVDERFQIANAHLISRLQESYDNQIKRTDSNFEWRRFHDYGKDYVYLAELYSKAPLAKDEKKKNVHNLLNEASGYFGKALELGDMKASTYWELGELSYTYPLKMDLPEEVNKLEAIEKYKDATERYTALEISKGWRAEAYMKIGQVYWDLHDDSGLKKNNKDVYMNNAKEFLTKAKNEYSKYQNLADDRTKKNTEEISKLLAQIAKISP